MTNAFGAAQLHYRFAEENGTEATSTLLGSEDTALSRDVTANSNIQLRILINEVGGGSVAGTTNASWQLQRSIAGGTFAPVTTSSTGAKVNTGSGLTDQGATTNRLTAPTTFAAGKQEEGDGAVLHTHAGNVCTEHVFGLTLVAADLSNGNALTFKLLYEGADLTATQNGAYTVTPTLNITKDTTAAYTQVAFFGKADNGGLGVLGAAGSATKITSSGSTNFSQVTGEIFRVRFRIQQTNAAATSNLAKAWKLKAQINGTGGYSDIGAQAATGVKIRYANSSHFSDNAAIGTGTFASHFGSGTGTAIAGSGDENGDTGTITFSTGAASHTEVEFALELVKGEAVATDTFELRVYETGNTALAVYTATPTITALAVVNTGEPGDPDFDHAINAALKLFVGSHPSGASELGTERVAGGTITTYGSAAFTADHPDRPWKALDVPGTSADGARTPITALVDDCHIHYTIWADVQVDAVVSASKLLSVPEDTGWSLPWAKLAWGRSGTTTQQQHIVTDTHPTHENTSTTRDSSFPTSAGRYRIWMRRNGEVLQVGLGASQVGADVALSSTEIRIGWLVATQPINFLNRSHTSTGEGLDGKLYQLRMWSRVLSDTELSDLNSDPLLGVNAPASDPSITSIDSDDVVQDGQTGVVIAGSTFGASETGSAKVEISNNATYGSGTVVELDATSWSATSITVTMRQESDSAALGTLLTLALNPAYLWVTSSTGERNATGFQFTLNSVTTVEIRAVEWNAQWTVDAGMVFLDTGTIAVAGTELTGAAASVLLDTENISAAGSDLLTAASVLLDSGAIDAPTGADLLAPTAVTLDASTAPAVAGSDLTTLEARTVTLDDGAITVAGEDLTSASIAVVLDDGAITVAGSDLLVSSSVGLDEGTVATAGDDLAVALTALLDDGATTVAGSDITPLEAGAILLDSGAITVAGADLIFDAPATVELDAGALTAEGTDLTLPASVLLDEGAITAAGDDLVPLEAGAVLLDSGDIAVAGDDLNVVAPATVELDAGAITADSSELALTSALVLDTGTLTSAGEDLAQLLVTTLDSGAITVVGGDVTPLEEGAILLDSGTITVAGQDLIVLAPASIELDIGAITAEGSDLSPALSIVLDTGTAALAGVDLLTLEEGAVALDTGTITAAGQDLGIDAPAILALDVGTIGAAGADLSAGTTITLDSGSLAVAGDNLGLAIQPTLDAGAVAVAGVNIVVIAPGIVPLNSGSISAAAANDLVPRIRLHLAAGGIEIEDSNDLDISVFIPTPSRTTTAHGGLRSALATGGVRTTTAHGGSRGVKAA